MGNPQIRRAVAGDQRAGPHIVRQPDHRYGSRICAASVRDDARECAEQGRPFIDSFREWQNILHRLVSRAAAAGELAEGVAVDGAVTVVLALCMGIEMLWASAMSRDKVAQTTEERRARR